MLRVSHRNGEHLEHFHSYQKSATSVPEKRNGSKETISLHTDQGLFIALTPGLMVTHTSAGDELVPMKESDGFYILTGDGTQALVDFGPADDLVFMMGDGVNQYINPMLNVQEDGPKKLRATPHSVSLTPMKNSSVARVWYGLMVLPPSSAFNRKEGKTYGEIRRVMASGENEGDMPLSLGCSSLDQRVLSADGGSGCEEGSAQCWFRCMKLTDHDVSHETCGQVSDDHAVKCVNPRGQVSDGWQHGDYFLRCTDSVVEVTPYPKLPNYREEETKDESCPMEQWEDFYTQSSEVYDHSFNLTYDNKTTPAILHWSVTDAETGKVKGRLSFNGIFGWISVGFLNLDPDAHHNGMNGANIILGSPGSDYDAASGLDLSKDTLVAQYRIDPYGSAFRHWQDALGVSDAQIVEEDCFTALEFETSAINGEQFNVSGSNAMMWAANDNDGWMGYHSHANRGIFTVEWATGKGNFGREILDGEEADKKGEKGDDKNGEKGNDKKGKDDSTSTSGSFQRHSHALSTIVLIVAGIMTALT